MASHPGIQLRCTQVIRPTGKRKYDTLFQLAGTMTMRTEVLVLGYGYLKISCSESRSRKVVMAQEKEIKSDRLLRALRIRIRIRRTTEWWVQEHSCYTYSNTVYGFAEPYTFFAPFIR